MFYIAIQKKHHVYVNMIFFTYLNTYGSVPRLVNVRSSSSAISIGLVDELGAAWNFTSTRLFLGGGLSGFPKFCGAIFTDIDE